MEWHKNGTVTIVSLIFVCSIGAPKGPLKGPFITRRSEVQILPPQPFAGVSQLARESGSYPECHWFESDRRYHSKPFKSKDLDGFFLSKYHKNCPFVPLLNLHTLSSTAIYAQNAHKAYDFEPEISILLYLKSQAGG